MIWVEIYQHQAWANYNATSWIIIHFTPSTPRGQCFILLLPTTRVAPNVAQLMPSNPNRRKKTTKRPLCWNNRRILWTVFSEKSAKKHAMQRENENRLIFPNFVRYTVGIRYLFFQAGKITTLNLSRGKVGLFGTKKKHVDMEKTRIEIILGQESSYTLFSWATPWFLLDLGSCFKTLRNVHCFHKCGNVGANILQVFFPSWIANVFESIFPSRPETPRSIQLHPKTAACAMAKVGRWSWPSNASTQQGSLMTWPIGPTSSINWHQFLHHQSIKSWIHPWYLNGKTWSRESRDNMS